MQLAGTAKFFNSAVGGVPFSCSQELSVWLDRLIILRSEESERLPVRFARPDTKGWRAPVF